MEKRIFFGKTEIKNPLIASSSPLTETAARVQRCREAGFGGVVLKTTAEYRRTGEGYGRKVVFLGDDYYADASYEREILTLEEGLSLYENSVAIADDMLVIPSVSANSREPEEWLRICRRFENLGAKLIQLDFFYLGTLIRWNDRHFYEWLGQFLIRLQSGLSCSVMPKLNFSFDPGQTCRVLADCGIAQVSLLDSIRFALPERFGLHRDTTSYFGSKQLPLTLDYLRCAVEAGLEVCAGGGVSSAQDVDLLLEHGAKLVQTASYVLKNGFRNVPVLLHGEPTALSKECYAWCDAEDYGGRGCESCGFCRSVKRRVTSSLPDVLN